MKFLGHFLALVLATLLSLAVSSWILDQTLWSAPYLQRQADQTKLYSNLAGSLPKAFAEADPEAATGQSPLDPSLIKSQIDSLLPQFINHLHMNGPSPTIDLTAFAAAIGQPAPDGDTIKPLTLGSADAKITETGKNLHTAGQYAPFAAIVFIVVIIVVMGAHRFPTLARAGFETAAALGVSAGLLWLAPSLVMQALSKPTLTPIRDAIADFVTAIGHGIATQFAIAAAVFLVLAVGITVIHSAGRLWIRFAPRAKNPPPTAPPGSSTSRF